MSAPSNRGTQLVQGVRLNSPSVGLVAVAQKVVLGRLVAPEEELHPGNTSPAELAAVGLVEVTAMAEREVAFPGRGAGREGLEVALGLCIRRVNTARSD